jgi:SAM-dependent methyltransferase
MSLQDQASVNHRVWETEDHVADYSDRSLAPVEMVILLRYRDELSRRVLEAGCGAGRVLGYLIELGGQVHGIDLSPAMVEFCRVTYPAADVRVGDVSTLSRQLTEPFDAIFAPNNLIDVFDDTARRAVLDEFNRSLVDGGLLIFSSHNLDEREPATGPGELDSLPKKVASLVVKALHKPPADVVQRAVRLPIARRNRRRLAPLEVATSEYAIVNDETFDYSLLHYYVRRDAQERQLAERGFQLLECLDADSRAVHSGEKSASPWLHYIARKTGGNPPNVHDDPH